MNHFEQLVAREEHKRDNQWDPASRWRSIQETISWAEQQATVRRNTPEACRIAERQMLLQIASWQQRQGNPSPTG
jgi:hypothetical protein